ncbi:MAG: hypothetical protein NXH86_04285 [Flavobacteriaceae bacterium]|nr:hypothetical protein [Flavobacteriaceae bacterium]
MRKNQVSLVEIEMPKEIREMVHGRVKPFLEAHIDDQRLRATSRLHANLFVRDLKWLAFSCYTQGLADAKQVIKSNVEPTKSRQQ